MRLSKWNLVLILTCSLALLCCGQARAQGLPSGWTDGDVGSVGVSGSASFASGAFTVNGAGSQIYGTADAFNFTYQPLSGDGTIVARVVNIQGGSSYVSAGVMIRETLNAGSTNAKTSDWAAYSGIYFDLRTTTGGGTSEPAGVSANPPCWVKLARSGSTFSSYTSSDGVNWTQLGTSQTITMAQSVYIGLAVDSGSTSSLATATFDGVSISSTASPAPVITSVAPAAGLAGSQAVISGSGFGATQGSSIVTLNGTSATINSWSSTSITITVPSGASSGPLMVLVAPSMNASNPVAFSVLPSSWLDRDVGQVGASGSASYANGAFTVTSAGNQVSGTADAFHFVYQPLSDDGTIVARVVSLQGGSPSEQAGIMIRETQDAGSAFAYVNDWWGSIYFSERTSTGGSSSSPSSLGASLPYWVKLVRNDNTFTGYTSSDGVNWVQLGASQTINMAQNVYVGLAVARGGASLATATFDNVSIRTASAPAPVISTVSNTTGPIGSQVVISGSGFGASQGNSTLKLGAVPVAINSWGDASITATIPSGATSGLLVVCVAPSMNDSNPVEFTVTSQPLPTGWLDQDVGSVGVAGTATYASGTFTVAASGAAIGSTADAFHFAYQPLSGDGTIVARIVSLQGNAYATAGVMIRETLDAASTNAYAVNQQSNIYMTDRPSTGGSTSYSSTSSVALPYWVMLVRSGNTFRAYSSFNAVDWVQMGTSQTINMAQNICIGLAVSSENNSGLATATFDNVSISTPLIPAPVITNVSATTGPAGSHVVISGSGFGASQGASIVTLNAALVTINSWSNTSINITIPSAATSGLLVVSVAPGMNDSNPVEFTVTSQPLPTGWLDQDVGSVGVAGTATYASGTFTVAASGAAIGSTADAFHFAYQPLSGDGTIVARIASLQGNAYTTAGVMVRETLNAGSTNAYSVYQQAYIYMTDRPSTGGNTSYSSTTSVTLPYWVRLERSGSTFSAYTCSDGMSWVQIGTSQTINMAQSVDIGLAVSSENNAALATVTFDNVSVTSGPAAPLPVITSLSPNAGALGTSVTISGIHFGASQGSSTASFNGILASSITSWSDTQVVATAPSTATTGAVTIVANNIRSNSNFVFTVIHPVITSVTPPAAEATGIVVVTGTGFGAGQLGSQLLFNGVSAGVSPWTDTSLTARVPPNATSGPVTVTIAGVTSNAVQFTVSPPLSITSITPSVGPVGSTVTITGTGFGASQSNSAVSFYGAAATVSSWSDTQISVYVAAGASSGPVSVGVASITAQSPPFTLSREVQVTDSLNNQTTYTSEQVGGQWYASVSQGSGCSSCTLRGTISYTFDSNGNVLSRTDELGHTTTYTYDSNGNVLTVTVPITSSTSATTAYTYNSFGEVLTVTDPLGNVTTNTYDAKGNLLTVTTPAPGGGASASVTQFANNSLGELTSITDPLNHVTTLTYTTAGLIATVTDAQNNVTTYGYDAHGNRTSVTDALNHQTTFAYDPGDRLKTITYPDSTTTTFVYDTRGRRTSVTDQNSKTTTYAYDDADRLTSVTDAGNNVTTYGYDTENNLTSIKDANNHTTTFSYDAFGRVTKTTFPSTLAEYYYYDAVGNLTSKIDRNNHTITYTYDQLNRLTQKSYPDSTAVNYTYDNDSRLTQVTDPTGTYQFTFDNMGRLTGTTTGYAFLTGRNFTTSYGYDASSNRTGFTDPESGSTTYAYDTLNRVQTLTPPAAISSGNFGFGYDALSRRTSLTRPNSVSTAYGYDNLSRLLSVTHAKSGTTLDGASYTVENAGNRQSRTPLPSGTASNYTYDALYELTQVTQGSPTTESYSYDPVGNRLSSLSASPYAYNSSNELTSKPGVTYTYDYNGNTLTSITGSNTTTYAWDFENRLTSVTLPGTGGTVTFKYDPFGRRIYKSSSLGTSIFAYDEDNLIEETNASGGVVARYTQPQNVDEPLAMLRSSTTSYYQADGLGSVTSLSNATGTLAQTYSFDSFGKTTPTGSLVNPFQYTAREVDSETGLYFYRTRYFDPNAGRFLNEDLIRFSGGENFYRYTGNNPLNFTDPYGLLQACCRPAQSVHGIACHCFLLLSDGHTLGGYFKPPPFLHPKRDDPDDDIGKKKQPGTFCNKIPASKCDENRLNKAFDDLPWMIYGLNGTSNSVPGDLLRTAGIDFSLPACAWGKDVPLPHKSDPWPPPGIGKNPWDYK